MIFQRYNIWAKWMDAVFTKSLDMSRKTLFVLMIAALISVGGYILSSSLTYRVGFPLDDAWIHQTYARNLGLNGEWSFIRGQMSGGSTAPLWSAMLAPGFLLGLSPFIWTFLLGFLVLFSLAILVEFVVKRSVPGYSGKFPWAGMFIVGEWHLVWASASGMETLIYAFLVTLILSLLILSHRKYIFLGLLTGLTVWIRPDGLTLLGPLVLFALVSEKSLHQRITGIGKLLLGFGILFSFYALFNLIIAGTPFPNTYYAKQAEYAELLAQPLMKRYLDILLLSHVGAGVLLLPGVIFIVFTSIKKRHWGLMAGLLWFLGYAGLYALRLPVTYQHGRYIIPAMPIYFVIGLMGFFLLQTQIGKSGWQWILGMVWRLTLVLVLLGFWVSGAVAYGKDVAVIESEMVNVAHWVAQNTDPDDLIAAHDIGALGFFTGRQLLDMAGLVSPEVIPFIRDEDKLAAYLDARRADWLVTFPGWYPHITAGLEPVFTSNGAFAPAQGEENMAVYQWRTP